MIVLTSTVGGWRTAQINYLASWLKVSKSPSGGRAGWTPAAERVCAHVFLASIHRAGGRFRPGVNEE